MSFALLIPVLEKLWQYLHQITISCYSSTMKRSNTGFYKGLSGFSRANQQLVRIPLMADSDSIPIADSVPCDGGHLAQVS